jgi:TetR/AcrR family transcriptional regulator, transcriptional repressor for nem operon
MTRMAEDKRTRLIRAAAELSHVRGLGKISLADIAQGAEVPLGNVYYYFKTKAALGEAVVAQRVSELEKMQKLCETAPSARARLAMFIRMTMDNRDVLARAGCPVGSLCAELSKDPEFPVDEAAVPLRNLLLWFEAQFTALGREKERRTLALHLLAVLQGVSLLANCFHDPGVVMREAKYLKAWVEGL